MKLTAHAQAIIYTLSQSEFGSYLGAICSVIGESVETTAFILEQLKQHGLVKLTDSGLYTLTKSGFKQLNK